MCLMNTFLSDVEVEAVVDIEAGDEDISRDRAINPSAKPNRSRVDLILPVAMV